MPIHRDKIANKTGYYGVNVVVSKRTGRISYRARVSRDGIQRISKFYDNALDAARANDVLAIRVHPEGYRHINFLETYEQSKSLANDKNYKP